MPLHSTLMLRAFLSLRDSLTKKCVRVCTFAEVCGMDVSGPAIV